MADQENMSATQQQIDHNLNDVWTAVRRQGEAVAEIRQGLAAITDALGDFRSELRNIRDIATRPAQPVNWVAIASLCVAILIAAGSYAQSVIRPVKQDADDALAWTRARSVKLVEDYTKFGMVVQQAEHNAAANEQNEIRSDTQGERIARIEGLMDATRQQLQDVDLGRSRGWITPKHNPE